MKKVGLSFYHARDAMPARYMSTRHKRSSVKTARQAYHHAAIGLYFSGAKDLGENPVGSPQVSPTRGLNTLGVGKLAFF